MEIASDYELVRSQICITIMLSTKTYFMQLNSKHQLYSNKSSCRCIGAKTVQICGSSKMERMGFDLMFYQNIDAKEGALLETPQISYIFTQLDCL